jgi:hypothetical protein
MTVDMRDMRDVMVTHAKATVAKGLASKYAKRVLTQCEDAKILTPELRKMILDGFGDLGREVDDLIRN